MPRGDVHLSKFLARLLRHEPALIGLRLDSSGWASVDDLLERANPAGKPTSRQELERVVATNPKHRFRLSEDGHRIRARQGHSVNVDLGLSPKHPPERLYHGTAERNLAAIMKE